MITGGLRHWGQRSHTKEKGRARGMAWLVEWTLLHGLQLLSCSRPPVGTSLRTTESGNHMTESGTRRRGKQRVKLTPQGLVHFLYEATLADDDNNVRFAVQHDDNKTALLVEMSWGRMQCLLGIRALRHRRQVGASRAQPSAFPTFPRFDASRVLNRANQDIVFIAHTHKALPCLSAHANCTLTSWNQHGRQSRAILAMP